MQHSKQRGIEFHGDDGSLFIGSWQEFDAPVEVARNGSEYEPVRLQGAFRGTDWGRAVAELGQAIHEQRPHRATGAHAAHVVEIVDAIGTSALEGRPVDVVSSFKPPAPPGPRASGLSGNGSGPDGDAPA